jgi:hypothetical protein
MAFQGIVTGFTPNDGQGDTLLAGAIKTNDNFRELYEALGDGTSIGIATLTQLKLSGILTATSLDVPDINISGILTAANVQVSGIVTANSFSGDLNGNVVATSFNSLGSLSVGNQVRITSAGALQNIVSAATSSLTVTGDSTLTNVTAGVVTATEFNGIFNGTFSGNSIGLSGSPDIEVGIVTANTSIGIATSAGNAYLTFPIGDSISSSDIIRAGNSILDYSLYSLKNGTQHYIRQYTSGYYNVSVGSTNAFVVSNSDSFVTDGAVAPSGVTDSDISFVVRPDTSTELRYNYNKKFETTGYGVSVTGGLNVSGVSTFQDNIVLTGVGKSIQIGPSNDQLSLEHDANGLGLIRQNNELFLSSPSIQITNLDGSNVSAEFLPTGGVGLRYNNSTKLQTTVSGVDVTGHTETDTLNVSGVSTLTGQVSFGNTAIFGDDDKILMGDGQDLEIFHASNNSYIRNGTGDLYIRNLADDKDVVIQSDDGTGGYTSYFRANGVTGGVQLYYSGSQRFATRDYGIEVTGHTETDTLNVSGVATAAGFVGSLTGDATGLSGSPSITVTNITASGNVSIAGTLTYEDVTNIDAIGLITARSGVQVDSGGIDVTGVSTFQNDVAFGGVVSLGDINNGLGNLRLGDEDDLRFYHNGANSYITNATGSLYLTALQDNERVHIRSDDGSGGTTDYFAAYGNSGEAILYHYGNQKLATKPGGIEVSGLTDTHDLKIAGIATLGSHTLDANDFKVGTSLNFKNSDGSSNILTLDQSGSVDLYHNTNKKFETTASGVEVTGGLVADNLSISGVSTVDANVILNADLDMRDNDQIIMGDGSDLKIYHDGANSYVSDVGTGDLRLSGNVVKFNNQNNTATMVKATQGGSVELNFNNSKKFETTGYGVTVAGIVSATSFYGDGSGLTGITTSQISGYSAGGAGGGIGTDGSINTTGIITASSFSGDGSSLTGIVTSIVAGTNVTLQTNGGEVTINASGGGGGGGGTGINVQNNGVAIGTTITQTINFNNDLEASVNGSVVTVNSTAPSQATAIALAIALG